jgi:hypothetical protein
LRWSTSNQWKIPKIRTFLYHAKSIDQFSNERMWTFNIKDLRTSRNRDWTRFCCSKFNIWKNRTVESILCLSRKNRKSNPCLKNSFKLVQSWVNTWVTLMNLNVKQRKTKKCFSNVWNSFKNNICWIKTLNKNCKKYRIAWRIGQEQMSLIQVSLLMKQSKYILFISN